MSGESLLRRLIRYSPSQLARTTEALPRLEAATEKVREDQKEQIRVLKAMAQQLNALEQTLQQQQRLLDEVPEVKAKLQQIIAAYMKDSRNAEEMPAARTLLGDGSRLAAHASAAVARSRLQMDPCPHIVIEDLLPDDVYDELVRTIPSVVFFKSRDLTRQEMQVPFVLAPELNRLVWGTFFDAVMVGAMIPALTEKFGPVLDTYFRERWPRFGSFAESGITLSVSNSRIMLRRPGYEIKPHRDPRWAFFTCLLYLPRPGDTHAYGTQMYRLRTEPPVTHASPLWFDESECELVADVPARRNLALVFLNSTGAHGAFIPADAPPDTERYLYQVQFGIDSLTKERLKDSLDADARSTWDTRSKEY